MLDQAQEKIIERYKHPHFSAPLENPDLSMEGANPVCGDEIHLSLKMKDGRVEAASHSCQACTVASAAADLLAEEIIGKNREEILRISPDDIKEMLNIPLSPIRLKCALLPLETLKTGLG